MVTDPKIPAHAGVRRASLSAAAKDLDEMVAAHVMADALSAALKLVDR